MLLFVLFVLPLTCIHFFSWSSRGDAAAWAADAGVVAHDAAGGAWVTPVRVALALEGVGSETGSLLEGTCAELWARTSESSASPRVRTVADHVLLRTLVDVFMAAGWPSELALDDLGAQLVLRLRSGRVQLLLDEYLGRLGRFARVSNMKSKGVWDVKGKGAIWQLSRNTSPDAARARR